ncbi:ABC transporter ATP-binding protein [Sphaerobacter thermophilus]|jgi:branched-chain amino acid transport system ATP-binding protein|uniref:ABC transporter related protein n=1 Tax=Sphaerobacter thermophilus (strain ATCC 49802 / DSM 20745 / KCCM 41009 / NCIMB 13125 / S 6022) TaxID=479434 RepID=D1C403_SPHTD|nr:ABC transporter ATP-binding protein [Sphaerobacter thermophilus]ACZ38970.1 ABC transporter related protein [Sphaerobacter thermophilus DSM 20745]PZN65226.1 MAG: ABC transporter ATP-binding protein [Sphaerobacter thermophilus]
MLRVEGAVTGYGRLAVLHDVSIEAAPGQITAVFGPNGSGKSTLVKAVAGLLPLWEGKIWLDEQDLTGLPAHQVVRRGVTLMPQGGGVFPQLTVLENLRLGGYVLDSTREVEERVNQLLDEYPALARRRNVAAGNLSGGEQMQLAIARALVSRPRFLLLDEPSAGLSPRLVAETLERVAALRERGVGILMVEQNIREALRIADVCYILVGGANRWQGTPADLRDDRQIMELYLGAAGA